MKHPFRLFFPIALCLLFTAPAAEASIWSLFARPVEKMTAKKTGSKTAGKGVAEATAKTGGKLLAEQTARTMADEAVETAVKTLPKPTSAAGEFARTPVALPKGTAPTVLAGGAAAATVVAANKIGNGTESMLKNIGEGGKNALETVAEKHPKVLPEIVGASPLSQAARIAAAILTTPIAILLLVRFWPSRRSRRRPVAENAGGTNAAPGTESPIDPAPPRKEEPTPGPTETDRAEAAPGTIPENPL